MTDPTKQQNVDIKKRRFIQIYCLRRVIKISPISRWFSLTSLRIRSDINLDSLGGLNNFEIAIKI